MLIYLKEDKRNPKLPVVYDCLVKVRRRRKNIATLYLYDDIIRKYRKQTVFIKATIIDGKSFYNIVTKEQMMNKTSTELIIDIEGD